MITKDRACSLALTIAILAAAGCTRAGVTKAHAHAMKAAPASARPAPASPQNTDTGSVAPKVWELTALAVRKGPAAAS